MGGGAVPQSPIIWGCLVPLVPHPPAPVTVVVASHSQVLRFSKFFSFFALFQTSRPVLWNLVMKEFSFEGLFPVRINQISDLIQFQQHLSCQSGLDLLSLSSGCLVCVSAAFKKLNEDRLDCCSPPPTPSPSTFLVFLQDEHPRRGVSQSSGCLSVCSSGSSGSVVHQRPLWVFRQGFFSFISHRRCSLSAPRRFVLGKPSFRRGSVCVIGTFYCRSFFLAFILPRHCEPDGGGASLCASKTGFISRRHV